MVERPGPQTLVRRKIVAAVAAVKLTTSGRTLNLPKLDRTLTADSFKGEITPNCDNMGKPVED
jgi:hypothetical protein